MNKHLISIKSLLGVAVLAGFAVAQPRLLPAQSTPELPCTVDTSAVDQIDTVVSTPDSNGFYTIFDGKSFKGWFNNCLTNHSSGNRALGAIFRVDSVRKAIYSASRGGVGGLLTTKKKYGHFELTFDWWPQFGNDGGVFARTTLTGRANQIVLDYLSGSGAIYGMYSEGGFPPTGRNYRPWTYSGNDSTIQLPGNGGGGGIRSNWTAMTAQWDPTSYGCPSTGCVQADYLRIWNKAGWNQGRFVYYGGMGTAPNNVIYTQTYNRIYYPRDTSIAYQQGGVPNVSDTAQWIPIMRDSVDHTDAQVATYGVRSWIGLQVHSGGRQVYPTDGGLTGGLGTWYRNIKIRELDSLGMPTVVSISPAARRLVKYDFRVSSGYLVGSLTLDHIITVSDLQGRVLSRVLGMGGTNLRYELPMHSSPILVQIRSMRGTQSIRVNPIR